MAERKRSTNKRAIREMASAAQTPEAPKPETPKSPTAGYSISSKEQAEAAAPFHPRAGKSLGYRNRELMIGKQEAQAADERKLAAYKASRDSSRQITDREERLKAAKQRPQPPARGNNRKLLTKPKFPKSKSSKAASSSTEDRLKDIDAEMKFKQSRASEFNKRLK